MTGESKSMQEPIPSNIAAQEKAKFLCEEIEGSLEHLRRNRRKNQRRASYIKVSAIFMSGLVTVLLGLQIAGVEKYFTNIALVLGAIVTMLNALEPFFNFRALWVEHELALANLYILEDDVRFYLSGTEPEDLSVERLQEFLEKYKEIWNSLSENWIRYRKGEVL